MNIANVLAVKGPKVITIRPEQTIRQALTLLAQHNIGALVVVGDGGLPVGISSSPDAPPQGMNSFGSPGYGGPCPPSGVHHYRFTLYALDRVFDLAAGATRQQLDDAMRLLTVADPAQVFPPGRLLGIAEEIRPGDMMVMAELAAAQAREIGFRAIGACAVETVAVLMVDAPHGKLGMQRVPRRGSRRHERRCPGQCARGLSARRPPRMRKPGAPCGRRVRA